MQWVMNFIKMAGSVILFAGTPIVVDKLCRWIIYLPHQGVMLSVRKFFEINFPIFAALICVLSFLLFLLYFKIKKASLFQFCQVKRLSWKNVLIIIVSGLGMALFTTCFINIPLITKTFPEFQDYLNIFNWGTVELLFLALLIVPTFEEFLYRGLIFNEARQVLPFIIAFVVQIGFYMVTQSNFPVAIYAFVGGVFYTLAYLWSGSLWGSVIVQTVSAQALLFVKRGGFYDQIGSIPDAVLGGGAVLGAMIVIICTYQLWKNRPGK